jgi:cytosine deaminase
MPGDLLLRRVRPLGGATTDILVEGGRIAATGARLDAPDGSVELDGQDALLLPGLVDAHAHLDKTLWRLPWRAHTGGPDLAGLIANERTNRRHLPPVAERAGALLDTYVEAGVTAVRSHVDVDPEAGLASIEGVMAARDARRDRVSVELVAFPQSGMLVEPGTAELMEAAVGAGCEAVGGLDPAGFDADPSRHLDVVFGIAERHGCQVDIHLHDRGELGAWEIAEIIARTRALGLAGRVTISHAFAIAMVAADQFDRLADGLAEQAISLATVAPGRNEPLPLRRLHDAGVNVGLGQDGIRDLWSPYGNGDQLERAALLAWRSGFRRDDDIELALDAATFGGARALGIDAYGLDVGCAADFVLIDATTPAEAVIAHPPRLAVVKAGRVIHPEPGVERLVAPVSSPP